jgi:hypothetical protein
MAVIASQRVGANAPPDDRLSEAIHRLRNEKLDCFVAIAPLRKRFAFVAGNDGVTYLLFPARLSRNTPCSPNMFQNHQGMLTRKGRP